MLLLPSFAELLTAAIPLATGSATSFDQAVAQIDDALGAAGGERTSARAMRNADTLVSLFSHAFVDLAGDDAERVADAVTRLAGLKSRALALFVDSRSPKALYGDIFTGLLDVVEQRVLCARHLALAKQLDDALTQGARDEPPASGKELLKFLAKAIGSVVSPRLSPERVQQLQRLGASDDRAHADRDQLDQQLASDADAAKKRKRPKVYTHPSTVFISAADQPCPQPGTLTPVAQLSNDDSNVVLWTLLPTLVPLLGDGTVPADSAAPADGWITHAVAAAQRHTVTGVEHRALCADAQVIQFVKDAIDEILPALLGDDASAPPPPAPAPEAGPDEPDPDPTEAIA